MGKIYDSKLKNNNSHESQQFQLSVIYRFYYQFGFILKLKTNKYSAQLKCITSLSVDCCRLRKLLLLLLFVYVFVYTWNFDFTQKTYSPGKKPKIYSSIFWQFVFFFLRNFSIRLFHMCTVCGWICGSLPSRFFFGSGCFRYFAHNFFVLEKACFFVFVVVIVIVLRRTV